MWQMVMAAKILSKISLSCPPQNCWGGRIPLPGFGAYDAENIAFKRGEFRWTLPGLWSVTGSGVSAQITASATVSWRIAKSRHKSSLSRSVSQRFCARLVQYNKCYYSAFRYLRMLIMEFDDR